MPNTRLIKKCIELIRQYTGSKYIDMCVAPSRTFQDILSMASVKEHNAVKYEFFKLAELKLQAGTLTITEIISAFSSATANSYFKKNVNYLFHKDSEEKASVKSNAAKLLRAVFNALNINLTNEQIEILISGDPAEIASLKKVLLQELIARWEQDNYSTQVGDQIEREFLEQDRINRIEQHQEKIQALEENRNTLQLQLSDENNQGDNNRLQIQYDSANGEYQSALELKINEARILIDLNVLSGEDFFKRLFAWKDHPCAEKYLPTLLAKYIARKKPEDRQSFIEDFANALASETLKHFNDHPFSLFVKSILAANIELAYACVLKKPALFFLTSETWQREIQFRLMTAADEADAMACRAEVARLANERIQEIIPADTRIEQYITATEQRVAAEKKTHQNELQKALHLIDKYLATKPNKTKINFYNQLKKHILAKGLSQDLFSLRSLAYFLQVSSLPSHKRVTVQELFANRRGFLHSKAFQCWNELRHQMGLEGLTDLPNISNVSAHLTSTTDNRIDLNQALQVLKRANEFAEKTQQANDIQGITREAIRQMNQTRGTGSNETLVYFDINGNAFAEVKTESGKSFNFCMATTVNEDLLNKFKDWLNPPQQARASSSNLSNTGAVVNETPLSKAVTKLIAMKDEWGSISPLHQEIHLHMALCLRTVQNSMEKRYSAIDWQTIKKEIADELAKKMRTVFQDALKESYTARGDDYLDISILNGCLDKKRTKLAAQAKKIFFDVCAKHIDQFKLKFDQLIKQGLLSQADFEKTTATDLPTIVVDSTGMGFKLAGTTLTAHDKHAGETAAVPIEFFNTSSEDNAIAVTPCLTYGVAIRTPALVSTKVAKVRAEINEQDGLSTRSDAQLDELSDWHTVTEEDYNQTPAGSPTARNEHTSDLSVKPVPAKINDVLAKLKQLADLTRKNGANGPIVYNLLTSQYFFGAMDLNNQNGIAKLTLAAAHEYNRQCLQSRAQDVAQGDFILIQNIGVNSHGSDLAENSSRNSIKEATLMAQMALLTTLNQKSVHLPQVLQVELQTLVTKINNLYCTFLHRSSANSAGFSATQEGREAIANFRKARHSFSAYLFQKAEVDIVSKDSPFLQLISRAVLTEWIDDRYTRKDSGLWLQAFSVLLQRKTLLGCKSGNERFKMVMARVNLLQKLLKKSASDVNVIAAKEALANYINNRDSKSLEALHICLDTIFNRHELARLNEVSMNDQGGTPKIILLLKRWWNKWLNIFNTNRAEREVVLANEQSSRSAQEHAGSIQVHNGEPLEELQQDSKTESSLDPIEAINQKWVADPFKLNIDVAIKNIVTVIWREMNNTQPPANSDYFELLKNLLSDEDAINLKDNFSFLRDLGVRNDLLKVILFKVFDSLSKKNQKWGLLTNLIHEQALTTSDNFTKNACDLLFSENLSLAQKFLSGFMHAKHLKHFRLLKQKQIIASFHELAQNSGQIAVKSRYQNTLKNLGLEFANAEYSTDLAPEWLKHDLENLNVLAHEINSIPKPAANAPVDGFFEITGHLVTTTVSQANDLRTFYSRDLEDHGESEKFINWLKTENLGLTNYITHLKDLPSLQSIYPLGFESYRYFIELIERLASTQNITDEAINGIKDAILEALGLEYRAGLQKAYDTTTGSIDVAALNEFLLQAKTRMHDLIATEVNKIGQLNTAATEIKQIRVVRTDRKEHMLTEALMTGSTVKEAMRYEYERDESNIIIHPFPYIQEFVQAKSQSVLQDIKDTLDHAASSIGVIYSLDRARAKSFNSGVKEILLDMHKTNRAENNTDAEKFCFIECAAMQTKPKDPKVDAEARLMTDMSLFSVLNQYAHVLPPILRYTLKSHYAEAVKQYRHFLLYSGETDYFSETVAGKMTHELLQRLMVQFLASAEMKNLSSEMKNLAPEDKNPSIKLLAARTLVCLMATGKHHDPKVGDLLQSLEILLAENGFTETAPAKYSRVLSLLQAEDRRPLNERPCIYELNECRDAFIQYLVNPANSLNMLLKTIERTHNTFTPASVLAQKGILARWFGGTHEPTVTTPSAHSSLVQR